MTTTTQPSQTTTEPPVPPDWHATCPDFDPTQVTFGTSYVPAIPADFFNPGSDPFQGQILLEGFPIDQLLMGDTSTVVQRAADPFAPADPLGGPIQVPIEIVELSLVSIAPITITTNGGQDPDPWDVKVELSPDHGALLPGTLQAVKVHPNGGTFQAQFPILPRFTFTRVANPGDIGILDAGDIAMPPLDFAIFNGHWVHAVWPGLGALYAPGAQWVGGIEETSPGTLDSQEARSSMALTDDDPVSATHVVCPPAEQVVTTTVPPTTTTVPPTTTTVPPTTTTVPPTTTTVSPTTTTVPPFTTPPPDPGTAPHPADTGPGVANWRISNMEILSYATAWLSNDDGAFPGIPSGSRSAYVLRGAAIFLANFQTRYEDVGAVVPWGSPSHAQRWQELPDL